MLASPLLTAALFGRLHDGSWRDGIGDRFAAPGEQPAERIAHPQQTRPRRSAVEDDVEPVRTAQVAGPRPLVVAHLDVAGNGAALHLDGPLLRGDGGT